MKNKVNILKKIKKRIAIASIAVLLSAGLSSCNIPLQEYASQEEIVEAADILDCDTDYLMKQDDNFIRMKHNDGEPIYICFDDAYSEGLKEKSKISLDYIFGIVGKINDKYHYKIVDKNEFDKMGNKTKIYYTFGEHITDHGTHQSVAHGHLESHSAWYNFATDNPVCFYYELKLNKDQSEHRDDKETIQTLNHELLHAFGLGDVYTNKALQTTTKFYGNTFMNTSINFDIITPNDLGCLISLYSDENTDMVKMKEELEKYKTKFNKHFSEKCKLKTQTNENFEEDNFTFESGIVFEDLDKNRNGYRYFITVEDGNYHLEIKDFNTWKLLDSCSGKVDVQNGVLILKDVELKLGLRPYEDNECFSGGIIQDYAFIVKEGKITFYDYSTNFTLNGIFQEHEKSLTN